MTFLLLSLFLSRAPANASGATQLTLTVFNFATSYVTLSQQFGLHFRSRLLASLLVVPLLLANAPGALDPEAGHAGVRVDRFAERLKVTYMPVQWHSFSVDFSLEVPPGGLSDAAAEHFSAILWPSFADADPTAEEGRLLEHAAPPLEVSNVCVSLEEYCGWLGEVIREVSMPPGLSPFPARNSSLLEVMADPETKLDTVIKHGITVVAFSEMLSMSDKYLFVILITVLFGLRLVVMQELAQRELFAKNLKTALPYPFPVNHLVSFFSSLPSLPPLSTPTYWDAFNRLRSLREGSAEIHPKNSAEADLRATLEHLSLGHQTKASSDSNSFSFSVSGSDDLQRHTHLSLSARSASLCYDPELLAMFSSYSTTAYTKNEDKVFASLLDCMQTDSSKWVRLHDHGVIPYQMYELTKIPLSVMLSAGPPMQPSRNTFAGGAVGVINAPLNHIAAFTWDMASDYRTKLNSKNDLFRSIVGVNNEHHQRLLIRKWAPSPVAHRAMSTDIYWKRLDENRVCIVGAPASKLDYLRDVEDIKRIKPSLASKSSVVRGLHWFIVMLENYDDNSGVIRTKYSYITIFDTGGYVPRWVVASKYRSQLSLVGEVMDYFHKVVDGASLSATEDYAYLIEEQKARPPLSLHASVEYAPRVKHPTPSIDPDVAFGSPVGIGGSSESTKFISLTAPITAEKSLVSPSPRSEAASDEQSDSADNRFSYNNDASAMSVLSVFSEVDATNGGGNSDPIITFSHYLKALCEFRGSEPSPFGTASAEPSSLLFAGDEVGNTDYGIKANFFFEEKLKEPFSRAKKGDDDRAFEESARAEYELFSFLRRDPERKEILVGLLSVSVCMVLATAGFSFVNNCGVLFDGEPASSKRSLGLEVDTVGECLASYRMGLGWIIIMLVCPCIAPVC
ncbi:hypothetical protein TeGR_g10378, partial [Tetraparma gracilis]